MTIKVQNEYPSATIHIPDHPILTFYKHDEKVGVFDYIDGKLTFEGDAEESASLFLNYIEGYLQDKIEQKLATVTNQYKEAKSLLKSWYLNDVKYCEGSPSSCNCRYHKTERFLGIGSEK